MYCSWAYTRRRAPPHSSTNTTQNRTRRRAQENRSFCCSFVWEEICDVTPTCSAEYTGSWLNAAHVLFVWTYRDGSAKNKAWSPWTTRARWRRWAPSWRRGGSAGVTRPGSTSGWVRREPIAGGGASSSRENIGGAFLISPPGALFPLFPLVRAPPRQSCCAHGKGGGRTAHRCHVVSGRVAGSGSLAPLPSAEASRLSTPGGLPPYSRKVDLCSRKVRFQGRSRIFFKLWPFHGELSLRFRGPLRCSILRGTTLLTKSTVSLTRAVPSGSVLLRGRLYTFRLLGLVFGTRRSHSLSPYVLLLTPLCCSSCVLTTAK